MQRHILGIIALGLLVSGAIGLTMGFSTNSQSGMAAGVGLRAGLILGALWMAYPQLIQVAKRSPKWMIGGLVIVASLVLMGARGLVIVLPVLGILALLHLASWLFKPLSKKKARSGRSSPRASRSKEEG